MNRIIISIMTAASLMIAGNALAGGAIDLPATGQTSCWDDGGMEISCTGTGMNGETQLGVAWPEPRFTETERGTLVLKQLVFLWEY